jgi:HEAT repeat protein
MSNSRITEPDYQSAKREIEAILTAFESIGEDAWDPIMSRIAKLDPQRDHDEVKQLLEAAYRVDPKQGTQLVQDVLLGLKLPAPRLRWYAAHILTERDKPLAQQLLRRVLETESYRGVNPERAAAQNLPIPDLAAVAQTGFNNFVTAYVRTDDPKMEDTLLQVLGRVEHDAITIQECIEALGTRRCARAVDPIKKLYRDPPLHQQNPLFLVKCVDAISEILGEEARPWLEDQLRQATSDLVAKHIQHLLNK